MTEPTLVPRERFGRIVATPGVAALPDQDFVIQSLERFLRLDWGPLDTFDRKANQETVATADGGNVMGIYGKADLTIWIICAGFGNDPSDIDACYTTILLPEEY